MRNLTQTLQKTSKPTIVLPFKNSTLCENKEFFNTSKKKRQKNLPPTISDEEYQNAVVYIENMDTVYSSLNKAEKDIYNRNLKIVKDFLTQTKYI